MSSTKQSNQYESDGYSEFKEFFTKDYIDIINKTIDNLDVKPCDTVFDEDKTGKIKQIQYLYKYDDIFVDMLDKVKEVGKELLKTDFEVLNMQLFEKHPKISKPTRSHQGSKSI
jgi:hypothetical protein